MDASLLEKLDVVIRLQVAVFLAVVILACVGGVLVWRAVLVERAVRTIADWIRAVQQAARAHRDHTRPRQAIQTEAEPPGAAAPAPRSLGPDEDTPRVSFRYDGDRPPDIGAPSPGRNGPRRKP
jgi:hypothetical protein